MVRGEWGRDLLLPRAFSILAAPETDAFSIMLKIYGRGTAALHALRMGDRVRVTGPLGRGFPTTAAAGALQVLVAGGVGLPPLHLQAMRAAAAGRGGRVELFYGGRDREDLVLLEDFAGHGIATTVATEDGSLGTRGFVTVPLQERLERAKTHGEVVEVLACGPTPMLAAVRRLVLTAGVSGFLCLEEEMACGFGACLGCAVPVHGPKPYRYCCSDGPVFPAAEVRW
jgi:dihydroorotate dehydrogenase electron transfer subunit